MLKKELIRTLLLQKGVAGSNYSLPKLFPSRNGGRFDEITILLMPCRTWPHPQSFHQLAFILPRRMDFHLGNSIEELINAQIMMFALRKVMYVSICPYRISQNKAAFVDGECFYKSAQFVEPAFDLLGWQRLCQRMIVAFSITQDFMQLYKSGGCSRGWFFYQLLSFRRFFIGLNLI
jgi:hypothetical protein